MPRANDQPSCPTETACDAMKPAVHVVPGMLVRQAKAERDGRRPAFIVLTVLPNRWSTRVNVLDQAGTCTWRWLYELEAVRCR